VVRNEYVPESFATVSDYSCTVHTINVSLLGSFVESLLETLLESQLDSMVGSLLDGMIESIALGRAEYN
jgi:hypothetical protein